MFRELNEKHGTRDPEITRFKDKIVILSKKGPKRYELMRLRPK